ncbi:MAG: hypothetical protein CM15mV12_1650 [uncultured marine virus]|nr:MAG: hypothetical protein CM15mV12_1650 [uncultured marine virus]
MTKTDRPWGWYDVIDSDKRYKVKSIEVKPEKDFFTMHHHRAEHWVVVEGTALVQVGDEEKLLTEKKVPIYLFDPPII